MIKVTLQEIELLARLLSRAGVTQIEAMWAKVIVIVVLSRAKNGP